VSESLEVTPSFDAAMPQAARAASLLGVDANSLASGVTLSVFLALTPICERRRAMADKRRQDDELDMPRRRQLLDASDLGEIIRMHRERLGIAQLELAAMAGIDPGNLSKIERGSRRSHLDTYLKLCAILGIDLFAEVRP
jgi:DNA-binding XRE family transcriptional regulator